MCDRHLKRFVIRFGLMASLSLLPVSCGHSELHRVGSSALDCPADSVDIEVLGKVAHAEGCGRLVVLEQVCRERFKFEETTQSHYEPGRSTLKCETDYSMGRRVQRCRSVTEPGSIVHTKPERKNNPSRTQCHWVPRDQVWRDGVEPLDRQTHWEQEYKGQSDTEQPETEHSEQTKPPAPTETSAPPLEPRGKIIISELGDLPAAMETFRTWVGKPVRVALTNGEMFEGVLRYARSYTLWFVDGTELRFEQIFAAERIDLTE